MAYVKPVFTEEGEGSNPFINPTFGVPYSVHSKEGTFTIKDGERVPYTFEAEQTPSVKLYITKQNRHKVNELSSTAKELYLWILFAAPKTKDIYWLNRKRFMKECKIRSMTTFIKLTKELIRIGIITPTSQTKDVFWLNPNYFFRGDKLEKYKDHKKLWYSYAPNGEMGERQIANKEKRDAAKELERSELELEIDLDEELTM